MPDRKTQVRQGLTVICVLAFGLGLFVLMARLDHFTPTLEMYQNSERAMSAVVLEPVTFQGIDATKDASTELFSYTTSFATSEEFWAALQERMQGTPWRAIETEGDLRTFVIFSPEQKYDNLWIAKIAYVQPNRAVVVAAMEDHIRNAAAGENMLNPESIEKMGNAQFWKRFGEVVLELSG